MDASLVVEVLVVNMRGINLKVFNSRATHLIKRDGELIIIMILIIIQLEKSKTEGDNHIGEKAEPIDGA